MNKKFLSLVLASMLLTLMALITVVSRESKIALGEVNLSDATEYTATPQLADRTNLCPQLDFRRASSTTGVIDFITINAPLMGDLLIMDATTTNAALRFPVATSSNVILWLPSGYGTSTPIKMGVEFKRGLLIDYGTEASTTIGYRCGL